MKKFYFDTFNNLNNFDIIKGEEVNPDSSGLSKREWNELMESLNLKDKSI